MECRRVHKRGVQCLFVYFTDVWLHFVYMLLCITHTEIACNKLSLPTTGPDLLNVFTRVVRIHRFSCTITPACKKRKRSRTALVQYQVSADTFGDKTTHGSSLLSSSVAYIITVDAFVGDRVKSVGSCTIQYTIQDNCISYCPLYNVQKGLRLVHVYGHTTEQ